MIAGIIILVLAILGILVCFLIASNKRKPKAVCHLGGSCANVIHSNFNKTLGIPNEFLGIGYYLVIAILSSLILLGIDFPYGFSIGSIMLTLSTIALLTSTYLTYIQAFVIKSWCEYCLASAILTLLIFIVSLFT